MSCMCLQKVDFVRDYLLCLNLQVPPQFVQSRFPGSYNNWDEVKLEVNFAPQIQILKSSSFESPIGANHHG